MSKAHNATLDLYDREIADVAKVYAKLTFLARNTPNTERGMKELGKRIMDEFYKIGLLVQVDMSACMMFNPKTGRSYSPEVDIIGRVDDQFNETGFDHDLKRHEVNKAKALGEKYLGVKELPRDD